MNLYKIRNDINSGKTIFDLPLKVTFYARVSTDKDEQLNSLENQVTYFKDYITKNSNWTYIEGYIDEGISGTSTKNRTNFLKMINDSKKDYFDLILTKEISRFSRNTLDSIKYTNELLENNVGVYFLSDNINTIYPDSELRLTIMSSIAQEEVRKLSDRVKFGLSKSIKDGKVLGNSLIYGFDKLKGKLIINKKEAIMIKKIYELFVNHNMSLRGISKHLFNEGYKTRRNTKISPTVISRIITNPKYKGYYCGNKSKVINYKTKKKIFLSNNEWIIYKDSLIPNIVSEDLWNKANQKIQERSISYKTKNIDKTIYQNRYHYSGKIFCSIHNTSYHRVGTNNYQNNPVWQCSIYRELGRKGCNNLIINEKELDNFIINLISKKIKKNLIIQKLTDLYLSNSNNNLDQLNLELNKIKSQKDKVFDLYLDNILDKQELNNKINELNIKESELILKLNSKKNNKNIKKEINKILKESSIYQKLIPFLIDKIIVNKTLIDVIFKEQFNISNLYNINYHSCTSYPANNRS